MQIIKITNQFDTPQEDPKVDKASVIQALGNGDEALEILVDLINDDFEYNVLFTNVWLW